MTVNGAEMQVEAWCRAENAAVSTSVCQMVSGYFAQGGDIKKYPLKIYHLLKF